MRKIDYYKWGNFGGPGGPYIESRGTKESAKENLITMESCVTRKSN